MITNLFKKFKKNNDIHISNVKTYKNIEKEELLNSKSQSVLEYPIIPNTIDVINEKILNPLTLKVRLSQNQKV